MFSRHKCSNYIHSTVARLARGLTPFYCILHKLTHITLHKHAYYFMGLYLLLFLCDIISPFYYVTILRMVLCVYYIQTASVQWQDSRKDILFYG